MKPAYLASGVLFAALGANGQATAVTQQRVNSQAAVNNCQGALPSFEGAFRKRPLAIANEGSTTAFISCAISTELVGSTGIRVLNAGLINRSAVAANVACTFVNGLAAPFGAPVFFPKTFTVAPGSGLVARWTANDNNGNNFTIPSLSCALPPQVEIDSTQIFYDIDVGN